MITFKKGFTLIEIICAISIMLFIFIYVFSISSYTINLSKHTQSQSSVRQTQSNLEQYIKNLFTKENLSLDSIDKDNNIINFSTLNREDPTNYNSAYIFSKKQLVFKKNLNCIRLVTYNNKYRMENNKLIFVDTDTRKNGNNIVAENIQDMKIDFVDNKLIFDITIKKGDVEENINFYIKHLKKKNFI